MTVRAACVIGWPVAHSRSPLIHGYWIKQHGLAADYRREALKPEEVADFFAGLSARGYVGCNVTLPHKEAALAASEPDDRARAIGAANTLWLVGGRLLSTNTDVEGFTNNLDAAVPDWDRGQKEVVVLGAGGSARAVVYGLIERGFARIHVVNRTFDRAQALRERFGAAVQPANWSALPQLLARAGLLVNTTLLGMAGQARLEIELASLPAEAVVADLVYAPLETELLAAARRRGLATADGLGMLLHQAVRGFFQWFGVRPQVTPELRALIEADLARSKE
ncbi:MAG TPA: shikimate dehydrogenase [Xanthobacteraceae bacterium]|jgi:shikimate dehydrogenase|nr:shikimate dehydrogenase [Xanthobacteraceae bacterium]